MFVLATLAVGVLFSFSSSILLEVSKYYITELLNADKSIIELRSNLDKELRELRKVVEKFDAGLTYLDLPSDWLDELDQCYYAIEEIEDSMDSETQKKIVTKFLRTNINHVQAMRIRLSEREELMVPRGVTVKHAFPANERPWVEIKRKIIEELEAISKSCGVSILGIGGLGKTVLAKVIVQEESIKTHFPCILFPPPSPQFDSKSLLDFMKDSIPDNCGRVLILLDGLESVPAGNWRQFLSRCLEIHGVEPKVLITTQNPQIAGLTFTSNHAMPPLSDKECFSLIQNVVKANSKLSEDDEIAINHNKKELIGLCIGSPLLAIHIGNLLSSAEMERRLQAIRYIPWNKSASEWVSQNANFLTLLKKKPYLKKCLAYFSLFPQSYKFKENNLVQFWMAEGFNPFSNTRDASYLDRATRGNFQDLRSCSLFEISKSPLGEEPTYKIDKLAYELAHNFASSSFCRKNLGNSIPSTSISKITQSTRHFSLRCDQIIRDDEKKSIIGMLDAIESSCRDLRTFLLFDYAGKKIDNPTFFQSLKHLRVLDLSYTNLTKLEAKHISKLVKLRYLDISHTPVENLPKLSNNSELQVLKLKECKNLLSLPTDLIALTNLICLELSVGCLACMAPSIGELVNLQRLDVFTVGTKNGFKIEELKNLNEVRESLCIKQLENVNTQKEAENTYLHRKGKLERLELQWTSSTDLKKKKTCARSVSAEDPEKVLEGLVPPKNLEVLRITNYYGSKFPEWLSDAAVCGVLKYIKLDSCKALQSLPSLQQLESLKELHISGCTVLKELPTLPTSLKSLVVENSPILKQRCQNGGADWNTIRGIKHVKIDSNLIDKSERHQAEAVGHQSSNIQQAQGQ